MFSFHQELLNNLSTFSLFLYSGPSVEKNWYWREYTGLGTGIFSLKDYLGQSQDERALPWNAPEFVEQTIQKPRFLLQFIGVPMRPVIALLPEIG